MPETVPKKRAAMDAAIKAQNRWRRALLQHREATRGAPGFADRLRVTSSAARSAADAARRAELAGLAWAPSPEGTITALDADVLPGELRLATRGDSREWASLAAAEGRAAEVFRGDDIGELADALVGLADALDDLADASN